MLDWLKGVDDLYEIIAYVTVAIICLLAILFGSIRERLIAGVMIIDAVTTIAFIGYIDSEWMLVAISIKATLLFLIYAGLTWRWPHAWLIFMTSLQCMDLLLVMSGFLDGSILIRVNGLLRNVVGWLMLLTFAVGIVQTVRTKLMARVQPLT